MNLAFEFSFYITIQASMEVHSLVAFICSSRFVGADKKQNETDDCSCSAWEFKIAWLCVFAEQVSLIFRTAEMTQGTAPSCVDSRDFAQAKRKLRGATEHILQRKIQNITI